MENEIRNVPHRRILIMFVFLMCLGRGGDFVGGIDNEALDFSQLEAFINSDNNPASGNYFTDSLNNPQQQQTQQTLAQPAGKLLNVIVENKRTPGYNIF